MGTSSASTDKSPAETRELCWTRNPVAATKRLAKRMRNNILIELFKLSRIVEVDRG